MEHESVFSLLEEKATVGMLRLLTLVTEVGNHRACVRCLSKRPQFVLLTLRLTPVTSTESKNFSRMLPCAATSLSHPDT